MKFFIVWIMIALSAGWFGMPSLLRANSDHQSPYAGQEKREIKSLSPQDIEELTQGKGWGLAKAAELNGIPGPAHLLEMRTEIGLTPEQESQIQQLYEQMKHQAIQKGKFLIELERQLNLEFAHGTVTEVSLQKNLAHIAEARQQLRYIHLKTHLQTPKILTKEQIVLYNKLRGYGSDPCGKVPEGHDPEMWKKHNACN